MNGSSWANGPEASTSWAKEARPWSPVASAEPSAPLIAWPVPPDGGRRVTSKKPAVPDVCTTGRPARFQVLGSLEVIEKTVTPEATFADGAIRLKKTCNCAWIAADVMPAGRVTSKLSPACWSG